MKSEAALCYHMSAFSWIVYLLDCETVFIVVYRRKLKTNEGNSKKHENVVYDNSTISN